MGTLHARGRSSGSPSDSAPGLPIPQLRWSAPRAPSLPPQIPPSSLSGYYISTRSRFGVVVVGLQLGAGPSGQPIVHWWVVVWLGRLGLGHFVLRSFWNWLDVVSVQWVQRLVGWFDAP